MEKHKSFYKLYCYIFTKFKLVFVNFFICFVIDKWLTKSYSIIEVVNLLTLFLTFSQLPTEHILLNFSHIFWQLIFIHIIYVIMHNFHHNISLCSYQCYCWPNNQFICIIKHNRSRYLTKTQTEDSQMAKREHYPNHHRHPEALTAKIAAMKEAQKIFATLPRSR